MGAKIKAQKIPRASNKTQKKSLDHADFPSHKNSQKALSDITIMNVQIVLNTLKTLLLNEAAQKILAKILLPKQIPKLKISNPKTSFDHPCHLKSGVPPQGLQ